MLVFMESTNECVWSSVNGVDRAGVYALMHCHLLSHRSANISCPLKPCAANAVHANECVFGTILLT